MLLGLELAAALALGHGEGAEEVFVGKAHFGKAQEDQAEDGAGAFLRLEAGIGTERMWREMEASGAIQRAMAWATKG